MQQLETLDGSGCVGLGKALLGVLAAAVVVVVLVVAVGPWARGVRDEGQATKIMAIASLEHQRSVDGIERATAAEERFEQRLTYTVTVLAEVLKAPSGQMVGLSMLCGLLISAIAVLVAINWLSGHRRDEA